MVTGNKIIRVIKAGTNTSAIRKGKTVTEFSDILLIATTSICTVRKRCG